MTAATTGPEATNVKPMPHRAAVKRRQDGARRPASEVVHLEAPKGRSRSRRLQTDSVGQQRRKAAPTVKVPPLAECLTAGGEACKIPIAGGGFALIDREDYELVAQYCWHMGGTQSRYPVSKSKPGDGRSPIYLHRLVMRAKPGELVDHRHGDRLNARKGNLRKATRGQNCANRSHTTNRHGFVGIGYHCHHTARPYRAALTKDGVTRRGKYRATAEEAARDYDAMAREAWGAFASLNFPAPGERQCKPIEAALEARQRQAPKRRKAVAHV